MFNKILYIIIAFIALLYIGFLTNGIGFFWCDFDLLRHSLNLDISSTRMFYPGPLSMFITKIVYKIFGLNINIFRLLKDTLFLITVLLIIKSVYRISDSKLNSLFAGLVFMVSPTVLKTTMWICDFELLTQIFLVISFLCYVKMVRDQSLRWSIFLLISFFLASQTTNGARFFSIVLGIDLLFNKDIHRIKRFILLIILSLFIILGTRFPLNTSQYSFTLSNIKEQLSYLIKTDGYIFGLSLIFSLFFFRQIKDRVLRIASFWLWLTFISQLFYQRTDFQFAYQIILLVPSVIACFSGFYLFSIKLGNKTRFILNLAFSLFIIFSIFSNLIQSNHYRGAWGSLFIGMGKVVDYIDTHNEHSLVVYQSATPNFKSFLNKNTYLNMADSDTPLSLKLRLDSEIRRANYKNAYLVCHIPDIPNPIDKIQDKRLITTITGTNNYLYDRLKGLYRLRTKSTDELNQFAISIYNQKD